MQHGESCNPNTNSLSGHARTNKCFLFLRGIIRPSAPLTDQKSRACTLQSVHHVLAVDSSIFTESFGVCFISANPAVPFERAQATITRVDNSEHIASPGSHQHRGHASWSPSPDRIQTDRSYISRSNAVLMPAQRDLRDHGSLLRRRVYRRCILASQSSFISFS